MWLLNLAASTRPAKLHNHSLSKDQIDYMSAKTFISFPMVIDIYCFFDMVLSKKYCSKAAVRLCLNKSTIHWQCYKSPPLSYLYSTPSTAHEHTRICSNSVNINQPSFRLNHSNKGSQTCQCWKSGSISAAIAAPKSRYMRENTRLAAQHCIPLFACHRLNL